VSRVLKVSLPPRSIGDFTIGELPVRLESSTALCHQSAVLCKFWGGVTKVAVERACRCGGLPWLRKLPGKGYHPTLGLTLYILLRTYNVSSKVDIAFSGTNPGPRPLDDVKITRKTHVTRYLHARAHIGALICVKNWLLGSSQQRAQVT
jgi:hypothetical protein